MATITCDNAEIRGISACLPPDAADNLSRCAAACGPEKAATAVKTTGFRSLRLARPGCGTFDLCLSAARAAMRETGCAPESFGAAIAVSITPGLEMPALSARLQAALGLPRAIIAVDLRAACAGYAYALHLAAVYAAATGKNVLLADGDVQSHAVRHDDPATLPVLSDAATATIVSPRVPGDAGGAPWLFAFHSDGAGGDALRLPCGGTISMDGFSVFRFVTVDALRFLRGFAAENGITPETADAFVPHQANMYMARRVAQSLGFPPERTWTCDGEFGNPGSASVPLALAWRGRAENSARRRLFLGAFGGGLSASAAVVDLPAGCALSVHDFEYADPQSAPAAQNAAQEEKP